MGQLSVPPYLTFPLRIEADGPALSARASHVREQIEQVLFTDPGERVYRPEFGAGARSLVFEPGGGALAGVARKRLSGSLIEALQGEVDPKSLTVESEFSEDSLLITISYTLATIGVSESHEFSVGKEGGGG